MHALQTLAALSRRLPHDERRYFMLALRDWDAFAMLITAEFGVASRSITTRQKSPRHNIKSLFSLLASLSSLDRGAPACRRASLRITGVRQDFSQAAHGKYGMPACAILYLREPIAVPEAAVMIFSASIGERELGARCCRGPRLGASFRQSRDGALISRAGSFTGSAGRHNSICCRMLVAISRDIEFISRYFQLVGRRSRFSREYRDEIA